MSGFDEIIVGQYPCSGSSRGDEKEILKEPSQDEQEKTMRQKHQSLCQIPGFFKKPGIAIVLGVLFFASACLAGGNTNTSPAVLPSPSVAITPESVVAVTETIPPTAARKTFTPAPPKTFTPRPATPTPTQIALASFHPQLAQKGMYGNVVLVGYEGNPTDLEKMVLTADFFDEKGVAKSKSYNEL